MSLTVALFSSFLRFLLFRGETSHKALKRGTNNQKASALPTQLANMIRKKEGLEILQQEKVAEVMKVGPFLFYFSGKAKYPHP